MIQERLRLLRERMKESGVTVYVIPSSDCHESEYVCGHYRARAYITGFTGSAGTAIVTLQDAGLWTDGRYFIQAEEQLKDSTIELMKSGQPDVPDIIEYLYNKLDDGDTIGFDGRTVSNYFAGKLIDTLKEKNIKLSYQIDLADKIWTDRPPLSKEPVWELDTKYTGLTRKEKLKSIRSKWKRITRISCFLPHLMKLHGC